MNNFASCYYFNYFWMISFPQNIGVAADRGQSVLHCSTFFSTLMLCADHLASTLFVITHFRFILRDLAIL
jgi:hypothetical protein